MVSFLLHPLNNGLNAIKTWLHSKSKSNELSLGICSTMVELPSNIPNYMGQNYVLIQDLNVFKPRYKNITTSLETEVFHKKQTFFDLENTIIWIWIIMEEQAYIILSLTSSEVACRGLHTVSVPRIRIIVYESFFFNNLLSDQQSEIKCLKENLFTYI